LELLRQAAAAARVAHAYLFCGPESVGKYLVAKWFFRLLNCLSEAERPCGSCQECQLIEKEAHLDLRIIASELAQAGRRGEREGKFSDQVRMEQLDVLSELIRHHPIRARWKMVLIDDAHQMNQHVQNRLLKTLEEPTSDTIIILVTHRPDSLLETIRSRCQSLWFGVLPKDQLLRLLGQYAPGGQPPQVLAALAGGSPGRALRLRDENVLGMRDRLVAILENLPQMSGERLLAEVSELEDRREDALLQLELLEWLCRDAWLLRLGLPEHLLQNSDQADRLRRFAARLAPAEWRAMGAVRKARQGLELYAPGRQMLEAALLQLRFCLAEE